MKKRCVCGQSYSSTEWRKLHQVGTQNDGAGGRFDLRNCSRCGSTLAVKLPEDRPVTVGATF
jgi:hypothetical protein